MPLQEPIEQPETKPDGQSVVAQPQVVEAQIGTSKNSSKSMRSYKSEIVLIIYVILALALNGAIKPFKRGFFCDDTSIRYPVKDDTIKFVVLAFICLFTPWLCFEICDKRLRSAMQAKSRKYSYKMERKNDVDGQKIIEHKALLHQDQSIKRRSITNISSSSQDDDDEINVADDSDYIDEYHPGKIRGVEQASTDHAGQIGIYKIYIFGLATTIWLTGLGKTFTGRMRPHFYERCKPDVDCTMNVHKNVYIENFHCTEIADDSLAYVYITTSWPSGHASIVFYSMIYLIIYINKVIPIITKASLPKQYVFMSKMVTISISSLLFALAGYISMTRITDYHHHSTDVISGVIIGCLIALLWSKALRFV